jgi:hypothetical protein
MAVTSQGISMGWLGSELVMYGGDRTGATFFRPAPTGGSWARPPCAGTPHSALEILTKYMNVWIHQITKESLIMK